MKSKLTMCALALLLQFGITGCQKYKKLGENDILGDGYIKGRVLLEDPFLSDTPLNLNQGIQVKISGDASSDHFYYSTETDTEGYFVFKQLRENKTFYISAAYTDGPVSYSAKEQWRTGVMGNTLKLQLDTIGQGIVELTLMDTLGNALPGAHICVKKLNTAVPDTSCTGNILTSTSNLDGQLRLLGLAAERYKVNISYAYDAVIWTKQIDMDIPANGLQRKTVVLSPPPSSMVNKITYHLKDSLGGYLPYVALCGFSSWVMANEGCEGSNWQHPASIESTANIENVASGNYLVYFKTTTGAVTLSATDTLFNIQPNSIIERTIILK